MKSKTPDCDLVPPPIWSSAGVALLLVLVMLGTVEAQAIGEAAPASKVLRVPVREGTVALPPIWSLAVSSDGRRLVTGHASSVRLWDLAARRELARDDDVGRATVTGTAFAPDCTLCATAEKRPGNQLVVVVRNGESCAVLHTLSGPAPGLNSVVFAPDGQELATASMDRTIRIWNPADGSLKRILKGQGFQATTIAYSPDGKLIAAGSLWDRKAQVWDAATGEPMATLEGHQAAIHRVLFALDGKTLATASDDMTIKLWDVAEETELATLAGHEAAVLALAFSPDGTRLASAASRWGPKFGGYPQQPSELRLWDVAQRKTVAVLAGHAGHVFALAFTPDGNTLVSGSLDRTLRLWDVAAQKQSGMIPAPPAMKPPR